MQNATVSAKGAARPRSKGMWLVVLVLSTLVGLASLRYVAGQEMVPPALLPNFLRNHLGFLIHISLGTIALLAGPWQFLDRLRTASPRTHRAIGWAYVLSCTVSGLAGLAIAPGSNGGPVAAVGFGLLALLWIFTTLMALYAAIRRRFARHRRWMIVSFSLTFAGVTLRLYLPLALIDIQHFHQVYMIVAWACWVPNLAIGIWLARRLQTARG